MTKTKIEYPGYHFKDLRPKEAPYHQWYHDLKNHMPEGYELSEKPQTPKIKWEQDQEVIEWLSQWRENCRQLDIEGELDNIIHARVPYSDYLPRLWHLMEIPRNRLCLMAPFPILSVNPTIIEVEDFVTTMPWHLTNGHTWDLDFKNHVGAKLIKAMLQLPNYKCVATHMRQTIQSMTAVFGQELAHKFRFVPWGLPQTDVKPIGEIGQTINFLFHGSTNHTLIHFNLRGGLLLSKGF